MNRAQGTKGDQRTLEVRFGEAEAKKSAETVTTVTSIDEKRE